MVIIVLITLRDVPRPSHIKPNILLRWYKVNLLLNDRLVGRKWGRIAGDGWQGPLLHPMSSNLPRRKVMHLLCHTAWVSRGPLSRLLCPTGGRGTSRVCEWNPNAPERTSSSLASHCLWVKWWSGRLWVSTRPSSAFWSRDRGKELVKEWQKGVNKGSLYV